ncbi:MAG: HD domain-containing protein [Paludibacteraceae bacterium]|nr:HD domain-containing protein [Paludibacteraceae bacterium]
MAKTRKIINDPVFGFLSIPDGVLFQILQHPYLQRLNRIRQLGLSFFVYPGAMHSRFLHSLGAMHLMREAIGSLREKGVEITDNEATASMAAILLHDVGHGPFSHVMEHTLVEGITHEEISLMMMEKMRDELAEQDRELLNLAIAIFKDEYPKHFLHQLISSQLDVDRLDYLCRDSFFCGVTEGSVASARILKMMNVTADGHLVVEAKGIYSVEKFLVARRLMYWQVYLHHTSVAAEQLLIKILERAKALAKQGVELFCSPALHYFLYNRITSEVFVQNPNALNQYAMLDDADLLSAIKVWIGCEDKVLRELCQCFTNRRLFKGKLLDQPLSQEQVEVLSEQYAERFGINKADAHYFFVEHVSTSNTYSEKGEAIGILYKDGMVKDIADASDMLSMESLTFKPQKRYLFRLV